ncbi:hypothetical protein DERF_014131 [Dermatophagoides farinae]|uniref:Uncharacterized protein n=1 Tax=Dermatophagoides farinae TaxID=6954 RepID=A0A922KSD8_DERFA|nr:hypothetical protein DERF_014131 [Dermatophagoides farinae]
MKKIANISMFIILLLSITIQESFADSKSIWFADIANSKIHVDCGLDYDIFGLSIIDDYLYQFEKCSVIIYPPPLQKYLIHNDDIQWQQLLLANGYRFGFDQIRLSFNDTFCEWADQSSLMEPMYSLIRLKYPGLHYNNHILLYLISKYQKNSIEYYVHDSNINTNIHLTRNHHRNPNIHYIMVNNDGHAFIIHNDYHMNDDDQSNDDSQGSQYQLMNDPSIWKDKTIGFLCIGESKNLKQRNDNNGDDNDHLWICLQRNPCETWRETRTLLESINLSFSMSGKLYLISKQKKQVLITDLKLLSSVVELVNKPENDTEHFSLIIRSLTDFIVCKESDSTKFLNNGNKTAATTTSKTTIIKKSNVIRISNIIVILVLVSFFIWMIVHVIRKRKKTKNQQQMKNKDVSATTTTPTTNDTGNNLFVLSKTIRKLN